MVYLGLAIWGAVHPTVHLASWFRVHGFDMTALLAAWRANAAVSGLFWDLVIAAVALTVFVLAETLVRKNWLALTAIPATFFIGVSCGLPLYLFLRTRPVT